MALAGASALEAMHKLVKDQNQALAKAQLAAQEAQAQARSLQERCQSLEEDAASLKCVPASDAAVCVQVSVGNLQLHAARQVVIVPGRDLGDHCICW